MTSLQDALRPFANFADARKQVPANFVITQGSSIARKQLTMGDCYLAREVLDELPDGFDAGSTGELLTLAKSRGADTTNLQSTHDVMVRITQDLSVPEAVRKSARVYLAIMAMRSQPPQTLPAFFTQDEILTLIETITGALLFPGLDDARAARLRAARKALAPIFCGAPDPVPVDRPLRWDRPQGAKPGECFVDVPDVGRYLIRRSAKGAARGFVATLNGKSTSFSAAKSEDVVAMVERSVRAQRMGRKA